MIRNNRIVFNVAQVDERGYEISHTVSPDFLDLKDGDRFKAGGDVEISLVAKSVGSSILVQGNLSTEIRCTCDRCLEEYRLLVEVKEYCQYFDNFDDYIDLTESIREDILLAFPTRLLCEDSCVGVCSICGTNLNISECDCDEKVEDFDEELETGSDIWSCFDNLKLEE